MRRLAMASVALVALSGCATKQFPQAVPVSSYERDAYTCRELDIELAKVEALEDAIVREAQIDGRSVLGFLGDFGIGNAIARSSAEDTVVSRKADLQNLKSAKGCEIRVVRPAGSIN